ncbi:MAG: universal stress protein [Euryarchaeota archaeon]|nr:universal stress protein [Euryarchaeota archaeon]
MFKKILIPINPSGDKEDIAVETAILECIKHKSKIHLVYLGEDKDSIAKMEEYVEKCRAEGLETTYEAVKFEGSDEEIPDKISKLAEGYDLVIMGHRKFDKIYRFVHQSTAADLINLVSIPVMVVPEEGDEDKKPVLKD